MLDHRHVQPKSQSKHDKNNYTLGSIAGHDIAIVCLPEYGTNKAAIAAKSTSRDVFKYPVWPVGWCGRWSAGSHYGYWPGERYSSRRCGCFLACGACAAGRRSDTV
ncbi:uncharacterized protein BDV17DRAFT_267227 [Aspergillus undulatus]|uniref:uncharacterized protein n=1 Tax=Aspergillus undulatus TaxID=1810928 RepID=UPI003CCDF6C7